MKKYRITIQQIALGDTYHLSSTEHIKSKFSLEVWRKSLQANKFGPDNHDIDIERLNNYESSSFNV